MTTPQDGQTQSNPPTVESAALPFKPAEPPALIDSLSAAVGLRGPLAPPDLALFAEMLAGLVRSKMPLPEALRMIGDETENRRLRASLARVQQDVSAGAPLPDALRRAKGEFPDLFVQLMEQGVAANDLHAALVELVREYRSQSRFRDQLWSQLMGPAASALFIGFLVLGLYLIEVPYRFIGIYRALRVNLPLPTVILVKVSEFAHKPQMLMAFIVAGVLATLIFMRLRRSRRVRYSVQKTLLRLPVAGAYLRTLLLARFCRLLGMLLTRKIPLNIALGLIRDSISFVPAQESIARVAELVQKGGSLPDAIAADGFFPPTLSRFVRGAEIHGELPDSLLRLAELYEERADFQGVRVRFVIFLMVQLLVGICVFFLILATFLPMFKIQEALQKR